MKKLFIIISVCFLVLYAFPPAFSQEETIERIRILESLPGWGTPLTGGVSGVESRIAPGDKLDITVWKNADLSKKVTVRSDGKISYPFIGTIQVAGLTIDEFQKKLSEALSRHARSLIESRIAPGDELDITVWKNADLSRKVKVRLDGKITYPLTGTMQAAGLTIDEFQDKIKEGLSEYIRFADVTVTIENFSADKIITLGNITVEITQSAGNKIIVFGEVGREGIYLYTGTITLLDAIAMAGGITGSGKEGDIIIASGNVTGSPKAPRRVNLYHAIKKGVISQDMVLQPNDVVYVPRTFIANLNKFWTNVAPTLRQGVAIIDFRDQITRRSQ